MASTELASAYLTLIPSLRGATAKIEKELGGLNLSKAGSLMGNSIASGLTSKLKTAAAVGTKALAGIVAGVGGLTIAGGISRALKIDQATMKFENMGLSVEEALKSCNEAVTGTAYGLDAAATVASSLAASGVLLGDEMTSSLKAVAGMAAMSGRSMEDIGLIFGKVAAQGRVQGDELMQFAESGINATAALATHLGVAQAEARELVKDGVIDFQTFSDAMYATFGEAAQGANDTFAGALSNVNAALSRIGAKFATPGLENLRKVFVALIPAIDAVSKRMDPLVEKFTAFTDKVSQKAVAGIEAFTEAISGSGSIADGFKAVLSTVAGDTTRIQRVFEMTQLKVQGWIAALKAGVSPLRLAQVEFGKLSDKGVNALSEVGAYLKNTFDGTAIELWVLKIEGWVAALKAGWSPLNLLQVEVEKLSSKVTSSGFGEIMRAQLENLPQPIQDILGRFSELFAKVDGVGIGAFSAFIAAFAALNGPITKIAGGLAKVSPWVTKIKDLFIVFGAYVSQSGGGLLGLTRVLGAIAGPVGFAVTMISALVAGFTTLMATNDGFRETVLGLVSQIGQSLVPVLQVVAATVSGLIATLLPIIANTANSLLPVIGQIVLVVLQVVAALTPLIAMLVSTLLPVAASIIGCIAQIASLLVSALIPVVMKGFELVQGLLPVLVGVVEGAMVFIQGIISAVMAIIEGDWEGAWEIIKTALSSAWDSISEGVKTGIDNVMGWLGGIYEKVTGVFSDAGSWLLGAGEDIISGLWDGISGALDWLGTKLGGIGTFIANHKGPKEYDLNLLVPNGGWIMQSLSTGLEKGMPGLRATLGAISDDISAAIQPDFTDLRTSKLAIATTSGSRLAVDQKTENNYYIDGINVNGTTDGQFAAEFMALMQRYGRLAKT